MEFGTLSIVLHAHLPYVHEPDYPRFLEERWLFEALSETYLPLLRALENLERDNVPFRFAVSVSPTLSTMLADAHLREKYSRYLDSQIALAELECERTKGQREFQDLALMYLDLYKKDREDFVVKYEGDVRKAFNEYRRKGCLDIATGVATHALLPLFAEQPETISAQVETAMMSHRKLFERNPDGVWLPDAAYFPKLERHLKAYGLKYSFIAPQAAMFANPAPKYGTFSPIKAPNGFAFFPLDAEASRLLTSETEGYPSDPLYRDFYRDIGFDLDADYVKPWMEDASDRTATGFKYWAVTGKSDHKVPYDPVRAHARVRDHAAHFVESCVRRSELARDLMDRPPLITAAFDAELFGHFWFEGIDFLEEVFRCAAKRSSEIKLVTPTEVLAARDDFPVCVPEASSWAHGGYFEVWLERSNAWAYRNVLRAGELMIEMAERFSDSVGLKERALNQCARELLLAQCSDWALMMKTGASATFARERVERSVRNVFRIYEMLSRNEVDTEWITGLEKRDKIFPEINFRVFRRKH